MESDNDWGSLIDLLRKSIQRVCKHDYRVVDQSTSDSDTVWEKSMCRKCEHVKVEEVVGSVFRNEVSVV